MLHFIKRNFAEGFGGKLRGRVEARKMKTLKTNHLIVLLLLSLSLVALAELDSRIIGQWVSSSGARIQIQYPSENEELVHLTINGGAPIQARLEGGDMDSLILKYTSGGSRMEGYFDPQTHEISVYEGNKQYSTWKKAR